MTAHVPPLFKKCKFFTWKDYKLLEQSKPKLTLRCLKKTGVLSSDGCQNWMCVCLYVVSWYVCVDKCMFTCVLICACSCVCWDVCTFMYVHVHVEARDQPWMLLLRNCHLGVYLLFRFIYFYSIYMSMCLHICVHHVYAWCLRRSEEGLNPVGTGVVEGGWSGYLELSPGSLQEQQMLLTTEFSVLPAPCPPWFGAVMSH